MNSDCDALNGAVLATSDETRGTINDSAFVSSVARSKAGGILLTSCTTLLLSNVTFQELRAAAGGAIYVSPCLSNMTQSRSMCERCQFSSNSANVGGAIAIGPPPYGSSDFLLSGSGIGFVNSTFSGNTAVDGGVVLNDGRSSLVAFGPGVQFSENVAERFGGVFFMAQEALMSQVCKRRTKAH